MFPNAVLLETIPYPCPEGGYGIAAHIPLPSGAQTEESKTYEKNHTSKQPQIFTRIYIYISRKTGCNITILKKLTYEQSYNIDTLT